MMQTNANGYDSEVASILPIAPLRKQTNPDGEGSGDANFSGTNPMAARRASQGAATAAAVPTTASAVAPAAASAPLAVFPKSFGASFRPVGSRPSAPVPVAAAAAKQTATPTSPRMLVIAAVIAILLVVAVIVGAVCGTGHCSKPQSTSTPLAAQGAVVVSGVVVDATGAGIVGLPVSSSIGATVTTLNGTFTGLRVDAAGSTGSFTVNECGASPPCNTSFPPYHATVRDAPLLERPPPRNAAGRRRRTHAHVRLSFARGLPAGCARPWRRCVLQVNRPQPSRRSEPVKRHFQRPNGRRGANEQRVYHRPPAARRRPGCPGALWCRSGPRGAWRATVVRAWVADELDTAAGALHTVLRICNARMCAATARGRTATHCAHFTHALHQSMFMFYLDFVDAASGNQVRNVSASISLRNTTFPNEVVDGAADDLMWWCVCASPQVSP